MYLRTEICFSEDKRAQIELRGNTKENELHEGEKIGKKFRTAVSQTEYEWMTEVLVPFKIGDVAIYPKSNFLGRYSSAGNHPNFGYSGYFRASIFDGEGWRNFKMWDFISEEERSYRFQYKLNETKERVMEMIANRKGSVAVYTDRTYQIPN